MKKIALTILAAAAYMLASAQTSYTIQRACHPDDVKNYDTEQLRSRFMMPKVMEENKINLTYSMYDRLIFGGVVPVAHRQKYICTRRQEGAILPHNR